MKFDAEQIIGNYRIVAPLGKGGMGEVYEVEHVRLGTHYALKAFALDHGDVELLRDRFVAEGKVLARLSHQNLVRVFELDRDPTSGVLYFVMDLVQGARSFADLEDDPAEEKDLARWFVQIATTLDYIHDEGIVHRDVKPSNILVDEKGDVRLVDFGVSRYTGESVRREIFQGQGQPGGAWQAGTLNARMGTAAFMAPEVAAGHPATAASDAYSLGLVFFHLLTGMWYEPGHDMLRLLDSLELNWRKVLMPLLNEDPQRRDQKISIREIVSILSSKDRAKQKRVCIFVGMIGLVICALLVVYVRNILSRERDGSALDYEAVKSNLTYLLTHEKSTNPASLRCGMTLDEVNGLAKKSSMMIARKISDSLDRGNVPLAGEFFAVDMKTSILMMEWCPPGEMMMGSPVSEPGREETEEQHRVVLTYGFWMGKTEVTQGQWNSVMDGESIVELTAKYCEDIVRERGLSVLQDRGLANIEEAKECYGEENNQFPVYYIRWEQATNFCRRLTERTREGGDTPSGYVYRLPTEAEWEYACRAGSTGMLPGNRNFAILEDNNAPALSQYAWYAGNSTYRFRGRGFQIQFTGCEYHNGDGGVSLAAPRRCATRTPNAWGLYDMLGNVMEWCYDWGGKYQGNMTNPVGPTTGSAHVLRGGSWNMSARHCRPAARHWMPIGLNDFCGFRVVLAPDLKVLSRDRILNNLENKR